MLMQKLNIYHDLMLRLNAHYFHQMGRAIMLNGEYKYYIHLDIYVSFYGAAPEVKIVQKVYLEVALWGWSKQMGAINTT